MQGLGGSRESGDKGSKIGPEESTQVEAGWSCDVAKGAASAGNREGKACHRGQVMDP